ncbi:MAG: hypothetical protein R6V10_13820 [bacterium]
MPDRLSCTWCGKKEGEVKKIFPARMICICSACVERMSGLARAEESNLAESVRRELDSAVQQSFQRIINQIDLGPLHEKYQRLMSVKFKEEEGSPTFQEVFQEFKKGVEAEIASDDYETRYDLAIAYHEMGLSEDAFREMVRSLRGALREGAYDRASEIISAFLYFHPDSSRAISAIYRAMSEAGVEPVSR